MAKYERILLATDFSEQAKKALAEAVRLARKHAAELHVLYVDVIAQQNIEGFDYPPLADYIRSMDQVAMDAVGRSVDVSYARTVTAIVRDISEAAGILRYAAEKHLDLIVLGTHGRGPVSELFLGSVAQRVVREAPISVMVVGTRQVATPPAGGKPVILAPVDFSAQAGLAMAQAGQLAAERGAHLVAVHAVDFSRIGHGASRAPEQAELQAREQLETFVANANLPVTAETLVGIGHAEDVIFDLAEKRNAGLIVIAPSGHSALDRVLLGSVTKRVVRGAPCPVLVHRDGARQARRGEAPQSEAA